MEYTIKAIPTRYAGVEFRSRLEARWAAFFDLVGWAWEYEPFDLDGWVPDFLLRICGERVLVEVKPVALTSADTEHDVVWIDDEPVFVPAMTFRSRDGRPMLWLENTKPAYDKAFRYWPQVWVLLLGEQPQTDHCVGVLLDTPLSAKRRWDEVHAGLNCTERGVHWKEAGNRVQWKPRA